MTTDAKSSPLNTIEQLAADFDAAIQRHGHTPFLRPSTASIRKINAHFGITLPNDLIEFARHAKYFGNWFAGLGDDFDSLDHITRINSYWRRRRPKRAIPRHLVVINRGFDGDLDCLDLTSFDDAVGEYAVQYWFPGMVSEEMPRNRHGTFREYIDAHLRHWMQPAR